MEFTFESMVLTIHRRMKQGVPCLFESNEHRKIPVEVFDGNTIETLQHFFQSAMQAVDRIQMV